MLPRFHWADITTIGHYLGVLVVITGALMLLPALVACALGEMDSFVGFAFGMAVCLVLGSLLTALRRHALDRRRLLVLIGVSWVVVAICASIPLYVSGDFGSYLDACFDALSCFTTTGASMALDRDHMARSQVLWRAELGASGALYVVFIAVALRVFGQGGRALPAQGRGRGTRERGSVLLQTLRFVTGVFSLYAGIGLLIVFLICLVLGLAPLDALVEGLCLVASALSTSSFTPHASGLVYYHSLVIEGVLAVLMLLGAMNFAVFALSSRGEGRLLRRNSELRFYVLWVLVLVVFLTVSLAGTTCASSVSGLFANGVFPVLSAVTTSGLQSIYPEQFGTAIDESVLLILCLGMLFGACSHSTGGGIKACRIVIVLRWVAYSIVHTVLPRNAHVRVRYEHYGPQSVDARLATSAMTVTILYIVAAALGAMLFIAHGNGSIQSVFEAVSYVSNSGSTCALSSSDMALDLKLAAMLLMWMGRMEFIAVFAVVALPLLALNPAGLGKSIGRHVRARRASRRQGGGAWRKRKERAGRSHDGHPGAQCVLVFALAASLLAAGPASQLALAATGELGSVQVPASEIETLGDDAAYRQLTVEELLDATERLDGKLVEFSGEVIGAAIAADATHSWVNVLSDGKMIGVYVSDELAAQLTAYGAYGMRGDTVTVRGTYHLACEDHACELEVHATSLNVEEQGEAVVHTWSCELLLCAVVLAVLGLVVVLVRFVLWRRASGGRVGRLWR